MHYKAIGYALVDLKGIDPSMCIHYILIEDDHQPLIGHQRRLNPNMEEVAKKEISKLLKEGISYPIFDSKWISPVHVVHKKGNMAVIKNENNELIPTRTVTGWHMCIDYEN